MKTFVKNILAVCAIIFASAVPALAYDFEVDGIYFNIVSASDRTCEVTSGDTKYSGDVVIPESVMYKNQRLTVSKIGTRTFYGCGSLNKISLPNSITEIGDYAFYNCSSLTDITIPNSVKEIGTSAFSDCKNLIAVTLSENLTAIRSELFYGCDKLESIIIPNSVSWIGSEAFRDCENLKKINFPDNLTSIGSCAFYMCKNLEEINRFPDTLVEIGAGAFAWCPDWSEIIIPKSVKKIGGSAFWGVNLETLVFESGPELLEFYGDSYSYCYVFSSSKNLIIGRPMKAYYINQAHVNNPKEPIYKEDNLYGSLPSGVEKLTILNSAVLKGSYSISINDSHFRGLKTLVLGDGIDYPTSLANCSSLLIVVLKNPTPLACPTFTEKQYTDLTLYVPKGSLSTYQNADGWKNFWDIREGDGSEESEIEGVKISSEKQEIGRYDIQGRNVSEDYKGFVIIRYSDGSVRKILNK